MSYNIFTKPTEAFRYEIENPSVLRALIFVIITSILLSILALSIGGTIITAGAILILNIFQWLVISIVLWAFEFMFSPKKRKIHELSFKEAVSLTGKIWMASAIIVFLILIGIILSIVGLSVIAIILIFIMGIILIIDTYKMTQVALDIETKRAIIPWILLILVYFLLLAFIMQISELTLPIF